MKSKMFKKLMAASLVAAMAVSMAGCGEKETGGEASTTPSSNDGGSSTTTPSSSDPASTEGGEDVVDPYTPIIDPATGKAYDLGGMEIIIRNWWAPAEPAAPANDYEEARDEWRKWAMETYNFTIRKLLWVTGLQLLRISLIT